MIFEIVNPSDAYTLEVEPEQFKLAAFATIVVGRGKLGLTAYRTETDRLEMPLFPLGGAAEWWEERFGRKLGEDAADIPEDPIQLRALAAIADSVMIGTVKDRDTYRAGLELIDDPAKRQAWRDRWHDQRRTSMNDIGGAFWSYAELWRAQADHLDPQPRLE